MSERSVTDLFEAVPFVPNADFIASLRARLEAEFAVESPPLRPTASRGLSDEQATSLDARDVVVSFDGGKRRGGGGRRRLSWTLVAAAAIIAAVVVIRVVASPSHQTITNTPPTTTLREHAYQQEVDGMLEVDGGTLQFSGSIQLDSAKVDATNPAQVTLTPMVDLTLQTSSEGSVNVTQAYVQLYFDTGLIDCVVSKGACAEGGVVTPPLAAVSSVSAEQPLAVATRSSAPLAVHAVSDGTDVTRAAAAGNLVAGIAVVVIDNTGAVATQIFDGNGRLRVSCSALPDLCMNSSRSVLPSSASSTTVAANAEPQQLPLGLVPPGTYAFRDFIVPFAITTVGDWSGNGTFGAALGVHFERNTPYWATLTFSRAPSYMTSVDDVFANCASDSTGATTPVPAVLLGVPALQADAVAHGDCWTQLIGRFHDGDSARIVAAQIDGQIIILVASASSNEWPAFSAEIDKTLASVVALR